MWMSTLYLLTPRPFISILMSLSLHLFDHSYTLPHEEQKDETSLIEYLMTGNKSQLNSTQVNASQRKSTQFNASQHGSNRVKLSQQEITRVIESQNKRTRVNESNKEENNR